jgi:Pyridoxamine 5'-phosphate oxidase
MTMTQEELEIALKFARSQRLAVLSTVSTEGQPQAALMGIAITPDFEIVFDTLRTTRKYYNLCANRRVALVIGCASEITLQYEGSAEELRGDELAKYLPVYFAAFPDGPERQNWPGMTYFVVRPKWLRHCDYGHRPPLIREFEWRV